VTEFTLCMISAHFMANRIVIPVIDLGDVQLAQQQFAQDVVGTNLLL
jgi:hypothetical protein